MPQLQPPPVILPVVYIAGKYRAPTVWQVQANIRTAQEAALEVWKSGAVALCPHSNTGLFQGECDESVWLEGDKELLRRCDAVLMIADWRESSGARAEYTLAVEIGLPVFEHIRRLQAWVAEWKVTRVAE
jgi:hypothetical protein